MQYIRTMHDAERRRFWSITLYDVIAHKVLVRSAQNVLHASPSKSKYHREQQCCHVTGDNEEREM